MRANIIKDINKTKDKLITRAKKYGIYENFGQKEYLQLKDKWSKYVGEFGQETDKKINDELDNFFKWCINLDDRQINI